jgi:hypothetical protein
MSVPSHNPYQAPEFVVTEPESLEATVPRIRVHPPGSILIATFLGSFFAGSLVIAINLWKVGRAGTAVILAASSFATVTALLLSLIFLNVDVPSLVLLLAQMAAAWIVSLLVWEPVRRSIPSGKLAFASKWWGAGIGIVACIPVGALLVALMLLYDMSLGKKFEVAGGNDCYISGAATEEDARFLGQFLLEEGFLREDGGAMLQLSKRGGQYVVTLVFAEGLEDPETPNWARGVGEELARQRFGTPLVIVLTDDELYERQRVTIE